MSKLLLDEKPLLIMPTLACKIGLNEAIIVQQIHYWNQINESANNNFKDGYYWTFNSFEDWYKQFPFMSVSTIKRTFQRLEKCGLLVSANYNKLKIDRTKWYRINYKTLENIETSPLCQNEPIIVSNCSEQSIKLTQPLPESNPKSNPKNNIDYIILSQNDDALISFYLSVYSEYYSKPHPTLTQDNFNRLENVIEAIKETVEYEEYCDAVIDYFENLPNNNNGSIVSFMYACFRYFEINTVRLEDL